MHGASSLPYARSSYRKEIVTAARHLLPALGTAGVLPAPLPPLAAGWLPAALLLAQPAPSGTQAACHRVIMPAIKPAGYAVGWPPHRLSWLLLGAEGAGECRCSVPQSLTEGRRTE